VLPFSHVANCIVGNVRYGGRGTEQMVDMREFGTAPSKMPIAVENR
jgi:hypothetical protein